MDDVVNYVAEAIRSFGGVTEAVLATGIPEKRWYEMRRKGRIRDSELCFFVAEKTGIPADKLAAYQPGRDRLPSRRALKTPYRSRRRRRSASPTRKAA